MSPEQLRLEPLNQQTDIYSLGVTMFRLLTGRLPYEAGSHVALTYAILNTPPPKPSSLRPDLPPLLDEIVMKAIDKDPAKRYRSWLEFGKDITRAFMSLRPGPEVVDLRLGEVRQAARHAVLQGLRRGRAVGGGARRHLADASSPAPC